MIYDCFTFFNELDLLEIRLRALSPVVDKFVLVEATKTHAGKNKPLYFAENRDRFQAFADKIIYVKVDDFPPFKTSWTYENHQRNCIARGLTACHPDDVILISDCDEIPRPEAIRRCARTRGIKLFEQTMFYYFFNYIDTSSPVWEGGTRMLSYQDFLHGLDGKKAKYNAYLLRELNEGTTATKIRLWKHCRHIANGGWHFSFLGGVDAVIQKIQSFSHQELNRPELLEPALVAARIRNGEDVFGRPGHAYCSVCLDDTFPACLVAHPEQFSSLIADGGARLVSSFLPPPTWRHRLSRFLGGRLG